MSFLIRVYCSATVWVVEVELTIFRSFSSGEWGLGCQFASDHGGLTVLQMMMMHVLQERQGLSRSRPYCGSLTAPTHHHPQLNSSSECCVIRCRVIQNYQQIPER